MGWRFAQISDVHLGAKLADVEPRVADALRQTSQQALIDCFTMAQKEGCAAVLIPGDLYDARGTNPTGMLRWVYEQAAAFPMLKILIAPGNTDAYGTGAPYTLVEPPNNVHIFGTRNWSTVEVSGVTITSQAIFAGHGVPAIDWNSLPPPEPGRLSILMLHGTLVGADDGRNKRLDVRSINKDDLMLAGYTYAALGHLHTKLELQRESGRSAAAYAGPAQILGWDTKGPGGFFIGELKEDGAELQYHKTSHYKFKRREIEFPPPYVQSYKKKFEEACSSILDDLGEADLYRLKLKGDLHESMGPVIDKCLADATDKVFELIPTDVSEMHYFGGVDPLHLPAESLLSEFFRRCSSEEVQSNEDPEVYELVRRIGWLMFTGKGLPSEIDA